MDESSEEDTSSESGLEAPTSDKEGMLSIDVVILDEMKIQLKQELIPQLMDMLYLQGIEEKDDKLSHFQYSLENSTDVNIHYGQCGASEVKCLPPGQTASFSFTNPFQAKLLEFKLEGWEKVDGQFSLDDPGVRLIHMQLEGYANKEKEIRRAVWLNVKPKGLKRRVQFITPHKVTFKTHLVLIFIR